MYVNNIILLSEKRFKCNNYTIPSTKFYLIF